MTPPRTQPDPAVSPADDAPFGGHGGTRARKRAIIAGGVLLLVGIAGYLIYANQNRAATAVSRAPTASSGTDVEAAKSVMVSRVDAGRIGITYAPVDSVPLLREARAVGLVTYDETRVTVVAPKIDGWIDHLFVNFAGKFVRRGDPLFSIYSPALVSAQEELLIARRLVSDVRDGTAEARRSADDMVASSRRRLAYWDVPPDEIAAIEKSGEMRRTIMLRAPTSGFVITQMLLAGQKISAGDAVYRIADLSSVWVDGEIFEQDTRLARVGARVTIEFAALGGETRVGRVAYVYPTLNQESRTTRVRVALANPQATLKPGMYATIILHSITAQSVLSVPRSALISTGTRTLVFVREADGSLRPTDVRVGQTTADRVEILAGLRKSDTVVSSGTFLVDAESNLKSALGGMGSMPGMATSGKSGDAPPRVPVPTVPTPAGRSPGKAAGSDSTPRKPGMR